MGRSRAQPNRPDGRVRPSAHGALCASGRLGAVADHRRLQQHRWPRRRVRELPQLAALLLDRRRRAHARIFPSHLGGHHPTVHPLRQRPRPSHDRQRIRARVRLDAPRRGILVFLFAVPRRPNRKERRARQALCGILSQRRRRGSQLRRGEKAHPLRPQRQYGTGAPQF